VFDDLAVVIESEEVHGDVLVACRSDLMRMKGDQIAFRNRSHDFDALVGVVSGHLSEVPDEAFVPLPTAGLCWMYSARTYLLTASAGSPTYAVR
jgi:hypothetical protein